MGKAAPNREVVPRHTVACSAYKEMKQLCALGRGEQNATLTTSVAFPSRCVHHLETAHLQAAQVPEEGRADGGDKGV